MHTKHIFSLMLAFCVIAALLAMNVKLKERHITALHSQPLSQVELLKEGDIIVSKMEGTQGQMMRLLTHSEFNHAGIIMKSKSGKYWVYEAVQPVRVVEYEQYTRALDDSSFRIYRFNSEGNELKQESIRKMKSFLNDQVGKPYDPSFAWDDDALYAPELVWKTYAAAGIQLSETSELSDCDLAHPLIRTVLTQKYGKEIPLNSQLITLEDIMKSNVLQRSDLFVGADLK